MVEAGPPDGRLSLINVWSTVLGPAMTKEVTFDSHAVLNSLEPCGVCAPLPLARSLQVCSGWPRWPVLQADQSCSLGRSPSGLFVLREKVSVLEKPVPFRT